MKYIKLHDTPCIDDILCDVSNCDMVNIVINSSKLQNLGALCSAMGSWLLLVV